MKVLSLNTYPTSPEFGGAVRQSVVWTLMQLIMQGWSRVQIVRDLDRATSTVWDDAGSSSEHPPPPVEIIDYIAEEICSSFRGPEVVKLSAIEPSQKGEFGFEFGPRLVEVKYSVSRSSSGVVVDMVWNTEPEDRLLASEAAGRWLEKYRKPSKRWWRFWDWSIFDM